MKKTKELEGRSCPICGDAERQANFGYNRSGTQRCKCKPIFSEPESACTETYVVIGPFDSETIAQNVRSYIETQFFRFMVYLKKISQMASQTVYQFVPLQDFTEPFSVESGSSYNKYKLLLA